MSRVATRLTQSCKSCCIAGVRCDDAAKRAFASDWSITGGPEIDQKYVVPDVPSAMRALEIVMAHPGSQDVIELGPAEADEETQTFALDGADERFCESVGVWCPVQDLDDPRGLRRPDGIKVNAELGVGVADQEIRCDAVFSAPHQSVAGLLGSPCRVRGIGRSAAKYAAAAEVDEHQHIGCPWPTERKYGLGEEVAGDHAFHMRPDECGPRQGRLLFSPLWARVNARLSKDAFDGICTGIKPQFFQLARDPLVALKEVFRSDPGDDVAQLLRQARPSHRLEGGSTAHLGEPAFVGRRFGNFYEPVDLVPTLSPDA